MPMTGEAALTGWGRTAPALTRVVEPDTSCLGGVLEDGTVVARGMGRGYGDCAVAGGGTTVSTRAMRTIAIHDGVLDADAGASLEEVLKIAVPQGWFVPVTPGTRFVTIGGAIASDIHGKNHHRDGTFGDHVEELTLMLASGERCTVSRTSDSRLFWATVGGMGLTGVITRAQVRMMPIETSLMSTVTHRVRNVDELMAAMVRADDEHRYSVAWVDTLATKKSLGRSVLSLGDHARLDDVSPKQRRDPLAYEPKQRLAAPRIVPSGLLNTLTVRAFNEAWFRKASARPTPSIDTISAFFHPLDGVADWNRIYGRNGFVQYQFVVPDSASSMIPNVLERLASERVPAFLTVLKRFGEENAGMLSFPSKGWTLAVDIPAGVDDLDETLDDLDDDVVAAGGRVYLAKDSRMHPRHLSVMYPRLGEFRAVRAEIDPTGRFASNLSRRLGL
jgi:decaprenylphospho-beta-D-ribofuranose 2-oxidase